MTSLDYLGHPCQLSEMRELIEDGVREVKQEHETLDPRALARDIGRALLQLNHRLQCITNALDAIGAGLSNDDSDKTAALVTWAEEYSLQTERLHGDLAALVIVALERGRLVDIVTEEAA